MNLGLTDEEAAALIKELHYIVEVKMDLGWFIL
jgi:hypothetical protein